MKNIDKLLFQLEAEKSKYKEQLQKATNQSEINSLYMKFSQLYDFKIDNCYLKILEFTNGFDNDGVVLYATSTDKIVGYDDREILGLIDANQIWHEDKDKEMGIIYAESELYLFYQNRVDMNFYILSRDDFNYVIQKTENNNLFFSQIINLALGINNIE